MHDNLVPMFVIMMVSGFLSTMNIWADNWLDMRLSINDIYMTLLMTGWMFFFMGLYYIHYVALVLGALLILLSIIAIRLQLFVGSKQYALSMIPHHSMAVFMSKQFLQKRNISTELTEIAENIVATQQQEIEVLKSV